MLDLPEMNFNVTVAEPELSEAKEEDSRQLQALPSERSEITAYTEMEGELGFQITAAPAKVPFKYLKGPYCKRTKYKPGRKVTRALGNRKLKEAGKVVDKYGRTG